MGKKIIIYAPFNNWTFFENRLSYQWIKERMDIFDRYTLRSMKNQSNQEFEAHFLIDPKSEQTVKQVLSERESLPSNVFFLSNKESEERTANEVRKYPLFYWVRLDSDNMFEKNYIKRLYDYNPKPETKALISREGYMYSEALDMLIFYKHHSPPFFTLIYDSKEYLDGKRYEHKSHCEIDQKFNYEILDGYNFLISSHGNNVQIKDQMFFNDKTRQVPNQEEVLRYFDVIG